MLKLNVFNIYERRHYSTMKEDISTFLHFALGLYINAKEFENCSYK